MRLRAIDTDERVGRVPTHFYKSRSLLRKTPHNHYDSFSQKIPSSWYGVPIKYDQFWDNERKDDNGITVLDGFGYTDFFSSCLYFRPMSVLLNNSYLQNLVSTPIRINKSLIDNIVSKLDDKYIQQPVNRNLCPDGVVFLPGTNLLERKYVDYRAVKQAVNNGAKVKPHPLTTRFHYEWLKVFFGESNVIDINDAGDYYLKECKTVFCCSNSEMGLKALLLDKEVHSVEVRDPDKFGGFESIYKAVKFNKNRLEKLISSDRSGIVDIEYKCLPRIKNYLRSFNFFIKGIE